MGVGDWGRSGGVNLLHEFHLFVQEAPLQKVTGMEVCSGRTQGMQVHRSRLRFFMRMAASIAFWVLSHSSWDVFCASWKTTLTPRWFCIFKRRWVPLCFSLANSQKSGRHVQSHILRGGNGSPERNKCRVTQMLMAASCSM